jgi:CheY-like chemotaxis protein/two-component sensor histidine kinase
LIKLEKSPIDMRHVLTEATEQVSPSICARQHHLSLQVPPQPAMVYGDCKRLIQIVSNVLTNACKYTREGGHITLRLELLDQEVLLEIADDGIGMEPDMVSRVFDLFAQAERTSDRSQGGLGLGLSIVQSLVASHGGSVQAYSEGLGRGSVFAIRLPRMATASTAMAASAESSPPTDAASSLVRVMVVDDNTDAANTLGMLLQAMGFHPSVQYTATSAIAAVETFLPHVCLLDIGLPDIDGIELAKRLRTMPQMAATVLIAVTGYGQERDRRQALAAGFDDHLVKPLDAKKLAVILAKTGSS